MKLPARTPTAFWLMLLIIVIGGSVGFPQTPSQGKIAQIRMTARRYQFDPDVITVKQGQHVQLILTATDHDHGIAIPAFGVKQHLKKGVPTTVSFIASKPGTFTFHCSVFCGMGHRHMKGKLIVKAG